MRFTPLKGVFSSSSLFGGVAIDKFGSNLAVSVDTSVFLYALNTETYTAKGTFVIPDLMEPCALCFTPAASSLLICNSEKHCIMEITAYGNVKRRIRISKELTWGIDCNADVIVTSLYHTHINVYSFETGYFLHKVVLSPCTLNVFSRYPRGIFLRQNKQLLVADCVNDKVGCFALPSGKSIGEVVSFAADVYDILQHEQYFITLSPSGVTIYDEKCRIVDAEAGSFGLFMDCMTEPCFGIVVKRGGVTGILHPWMFSLRAAFTSVLL